MSKCVHPFLLCDGFWDIFSSTFCVNVDNGYCTRFGFVFVATRDVILRVNGFDQRLSTFFAIFAKKSDAVEFMERHIILDNDVRFSTPIQWRVVKRELA